jgi:hypothetical protein
MVVNQDCISYLPNTYELVFPSPIIIKTFCVSTDKNNLFIVSCMRLFVYVILYYLFDQLFSFQDHHIIQYVLIIMIFMNIGYLGLVVGKNTLFSLSSDLSMFSQTTGPLQVKTQLLAIE